MKFECVNETFVFDPPEPRKIWHAEVEEAYKEEAYKDGYFITLMKGFIFNKDDPSEVRGKFWAYAQQPSDRQGAGEWTLISIHEGEHDGKPFSKN